jgi:hypothetical protein
MIRQIHAVSSRVQVTGYELVTDDGLEDGYQTTAEIIGTIC